MNEHIIMYNRLDILIFRREHIYCVREIINVSEDLAVENLFVKIAVGF